MRAPILLSAAFFAVAACSAGDVRLTHQEISSTYSPGEFAYAGAGRDTWVVIVGNPFGGDAGAFEAAVTNAMQGRHWGQRTNFTTVPGADAYIRYRVVLVFDPPPTLNGLRLCRDAPTVLPSESGGDGITLFAAYCRGKRLRTHIKGQIAGASGPNDPAFRELVGQVTNGLFPHGRGGGRDRGEPIFLVP